MIAQNARPLAKCEKIGIMPLWHIAALHAGASKIDVALQSQQSLRSFQLKNERLTTITSRTTTKKHFRMCPIPVTVLQALLLWVRPVKVTGTTCNCYALCLPVTVTLCASL
jgi:hypothetical protein